MRITNYGILIILILVLTGLYLAAQSPISPVATNETIVPLTAALEAMGATPEQVTVHGWTLLPRQDATITELASIVEAAVQRLELADVIVTYKQNASSRHRLVRADMRGDNLQAAVIAQVMYPSQPNKQPEVHLIINMDGRAQEVQDWSYKINQIAATEDAVPHIYTCLTGWFDGRLEDGQLRVRLQHAFSVINASVHDTVTDFHYISMSGYSPLVDESLTMNGKKVNVNMAMRYSPTDNRTYCLVGSPVITQEY